MQDRQAFVEASRRTKNYLDAEDNFKGFGLSVPRSVWFVPEKEQEPLTAQRDRLEENIAKIRARDRCCRKPGKKTKGAGIVHCGHPGKGDPAWAGLPNWLP